ncbi:hypothetical protein F4778DRAFT_786351 [Xylariomycetidae sp. FL2044]|nr:hypothetical protein F4778DRAFT_786351 [Xylariomycetidae sp. FL2044]
MAIHTRAPEVAGVTVCMLVLSTIATLLRVYCRGWVLKAFAWDDWLAVAAQILFIIFCAYEITGVEYGTGSHFADIKEGNIPIAMKMWWTCEPLYVLSNMFIKASIAIFLLRLCVEKTHRVIVWAVFVITEVYSAFFFLLFALQCRPTSLFWLRYGDDAPEGSCLEASIVSHCFYGYSAISCLTDWVYSTLPMVIVWTLQMNRKMKISVICVLAAGVIASSATIVRFPYLWSLTDEADFLYSTADVAIWSTVETGLGITTAGVATLRPLLKTWFGGGSSAPGHGTSAAAPQYRKTGSHSKRSQNDGGFDLHLRTNKGTGVTTVIDSDEVEGQARHHRDLGDNRSEASDPFASDGWNSSQSNLAQRPEEDPRRGRGWAIRVQNTIVQTTSDAV